MGKKVKEKIGTNIRRRGADDSSLVLDGLSSSVSRDELILHLLVASSPSLGPS